MKQPDGMLLHDCTCRQQLTACSTLKENLGRGIEQQEVRVDVRWRRVTWASSVQAGLGDFCTLPLSSGALDKCVPSTSPQSLFSLRSVSFHSMSCVTMNPSIVSSLGKLNPAGLNLSASDVNLVSLPQPPPLFVIYSSTSAADTSLAFTSPAAPSDPFRAAAHRPARIPGYDTISPVAHWHVALLTQYAGISTTAIFTFDRLEANRIIWPRRQALA